MYYLDRIFHLITKTLFYFYRHFIFLINESSFLLKPSLFNHFFLIFLKFSFIKAFSKFKFKIIHLKTTLLKKYLFIYLYIH